MAKRYVRNIPSKKVRDAINEANKMKKVLTYNPPETVWCKVCGKTIPYKTAIEAGGRGQGCRKYYMCIQHDSAYQLNPLAFVMNLRITNA